MLPEDDQNMCKHLPSSMLMYPKNRQVLKHQQAFHQFNSVKKN